jgi:hypothetical protein
MLGIENEPHRYDVVTVIITDTSTPQIDLLRNFWTDHKKHKEDHKRHIRENSPS